MNKHDRTALTQALAMCRAESPGRARQIDSMLEDRAWETVAKFASYCCQGRSLHLAPWQDPPCHGDAPAEWCDPDAKKLLQQMLAHGVSRWHPDPLAAIEATAERKRA